MTFGLWKSLFHFRRPKTAAASEASSSANADQHIRHLLLLGLILLLVGAACRILRYAVNFPFWCDEAWVSLNFLNRDFAGMTRPLEHFQVAPILFLWIELAVSRLCGVSEFALRALPLVAGLTSLILFGVLVARNLPARAGLISFGLLAMSEWTIRLNAQVKPYTLDMMASLMLLIPALEWNRRPDQRLWPFLLALLTPVAIALSFPVVFVAGAISVFLVSPIWRTSSWKPKALFAIYNLAMMAAFVVFDVIVGERQLGPKGDRLHEYMLDYWANGFPPRTALEWPRWLLSAHTGAMMNYPPVGGGHFSGAVAFVFFVLGCGLCWRRNQKRWLVLCLTPFALNFAAAMLHTYPYAGCLRLSQHLAPFICMRVGTAAAAILERSFKVPEARLKTMQLIVLLFAFHGLVHMGNAMAKPFFYSEDVWERKVVAELSKHVKPGDRVMVMNRLDELHPVAAWYLQASKTPPRWKGDAIPADRPDSAARIWCLRYWESRHGVSKVTQAEWETMAGCPLVRILEIPYALRLPHASPGEVERHIDVECFVPVDAPESTRARPQFSIWP